MKILDKFRSIFRRVPESVRFDDQLVVRTMTNGKTEAVRWADLHTVSVLTTSDGPWSDDLYFVLEASTGGCAVPQTARGASELLGRLQELPDFDNETFITALGSTHDAQFVCWQRAP